MNFIFENDFIPDLQTGIFILGRNVLPEQ